MICYFRELVSENKSKITLKDFMSFLCTRLKLKDQILYLTHPTVQTEKFTAKMTYIYKKMIGKLDFDVLRGEFSRSLL